MRELYRTLDKPGTNPLRDAQAALDAAVRTAYAMKTDEEPLTFLLQLNAAMAQHEAAGEPLVGPGLPAFITNPQAFITDDCIQMP